MKDGTYVAFGLRLSRLPLSLAAAYVALAVVCAPAFLGLPALQAAAAT
jgi:hypothetical protein